MIITFCGHADFHKTPELEAHMLALLEKYVGNTPAEFYLGDYGGFDRFALEIAARYKKIHPQVSLVFVTPYLSEEYQKNHLTDAAKRYDAILYPELENVPPRFAISHRNRYMVERADLVITYICRRRGGAYQTYRHALRKEKTLINMGEMG
jgi:uncharacterized phage-like protein YoqJ